MSQQTALTGGLQSLRRERRVLQRQQGYALVSSMLFAIVSLTITGAVLVRMSLGTQQVATRAQEDTALSFTESAINHVLDSVARTTYDHPDLTAKELLAEFHGKDFLYTNQQSNSKLIISEPAQLPSNVSTRTYSASNAFFNSIETDETHAQKFWDHFTENSNTQDIGAAVGVSSTTINNLHAQNYSIYHIKQGRNEADMRISIVPLSHSISNSNDEDLHADPENIVPHADILKIRATTYVPNILNPQRTRSVDLLIRRPVRQPTTEGKRYNFNHAILAGDTVTLNKKVYSGDTSFEVKNNTQLIDSQKQGDVHSNANIEFGAQGKVNGKVTAVGEIALEKNAPCPPTTYAGSNCVPDFDYKDTNNDDPRKSTDRMTDKDGTKSQVDEIPIPEFQYKDLVTADESTTPPTYTIKTEAFANGACDTNAAVLKNCYVVGDLNVGKNTRFEGDVYVGGNLIQRGNDKIATGAANGDANQPPTRVVVKGNIEMFGGGDSTHLSSTSALFVSLHGDVDMRGNPGTNGDNGAVFVVNDPTKKAQFNGTPDFFGAIISRGTVVTSGSAGGIQRDNDMSELQAFVVPEPIPLPLSDFYPRVISWKEN